MPNLTNLTGIIQRLLAAFPRPSLTPAQTQIAGALATVATEAFTFGVISNPVLQLVLAISAPAVAITGVLANALHHQAHAQVTAAAIQAHATTQAADLTAAAAAKPTTG